MRQCFLFFLVLWLLALGAYGQSFIAPSDRFFVPVSQVQFTIDLPDGNTTDAQLLEFECTERSSSGIITVGGTTYTINCVAPLMQVPLIELGRLPERVELHSNVATLAPDAVQYKAAQEYARAQAKAKADDQVSTNPAGRKTLGVLGLLGGTVGLYLEMQEMKKDIEYAKQTAEKALSLGEANSNRLNIHDQDIAMLSTVLTGSTCLSANCIGGGGVLGQLARNNLTQTFLINRTETLQAAADNLQAQLILQQNATDTILQRVNTLTQKTANATSEMAKQINSNLAVLRDDTNIQIKAIYNALNTTQTLIDTIRVSGDNDFEYIYTQLSELQDSAINAYSTISSLTTHKALRNVITKVFFDDLAQLDPTLVPLLKDGGVSPKPVFTGPDTRITMESIDMCFTIAGSQANQIRVVCQSYNVYSNVYYAIESSKFSVNYKHLLNSMGPLGCVRPHVDETSPIDFDSTVDPNANGTVPCQFYAEVVERSCELPVDTPFDFQTQNVSASPQSQDINIASICQRYGSAVITTDSSTQGTVLRTAPELSDYIRDRACMRPILLPYFYTRFYQTGSTLIIPQDVRSCNISLSQMERLAMRKQAMPLYMAFGTGWKLGWLQSQKFVSTLSLTMRGRMPGGVSNTDINYMPWTPTRLDANGNPILDGGADAVEQWTIYWLAVSQNTIPVYAAQSTGQDSVSTSATITISSADNCQPNDPTCYRKELKLGVKDIVLDAATYSQFPVLPYVFIGNLENAAFEGMYDVPSNLISAGFDPSIQVNKVTCLLMPPGTNRTLDIQYFWDVKGTLYDPKTCGIDPSQFRYDAFVTSRGFPYCNINGGSPVELAQRKYPLVCSSGFNYTANAVIPAYTQNECSSASVCSPSNGCIYYREIVPIQRIINGSGTVIPLSTAQESQSFRFNSFVADFWISYTNNSQPVGTYSILLATSNSGTAVHIYNQNGYLVMFVQGRSEVYNIGNLPKTVLDVPVHFVVQAHGSLVQLFVNGALKYSLDDSALSLINSQWTSVSVGTSSQTLTNTFIYGMRLFRYDRVLNSTYQLYHCGPYSSKTSGCAYNNPNATFTTSIVAEHDVRSPCPLETNLVEIKAFEYIGATLFGNPDALPSINRTALTLGKGSSFVTLAITFIDTISIDKYPKSEYQILSIMIQADTNKYMILNVTKTSAGEIVFSCFYGSRTRILSTMDGLASIPTWTHTVYTITISFNAINVFGIMAGINDVYLYMIPYTNVDGVQPPLLYNYIPNSVVRLTYVYNKQSPNGLNYGPVNQLRCMMMNFPHLPSQYSNDIVDVYQDDFIWNPPFGQCIMSPVLPGFGYCRTPVMCGGKCQAWSIVNSTSRSFVPLSHICDNGYAPPDCVRPCSRTDPDDGYCIDAYFKATAKNGFAPTSSHCATARTAGMTTRTTTNGKMLMATPYEWRQTFKVVIPSGRINIKAANSVCPSISSASQRADGKITVTMTNTDSKETRVVVSWYPSNPADSINLPDECINVEGNAISIKANTVGYFYMPSNGCGNLTVVISTINAFTTTECSRLSTTDLSLIVSQNDVTASFSPVVTRMETVQTNIVQGLQSAIEDISKSLISAFTDMISLVDTSNQVKNYSATLLANLKNRPGTSYNPNVTVNTNFSDPDSDAKYRQIMDNLAKERFEYEKLKNKSIEQISQYTNDMNNVNVTLFILGLFGDSLSKGFNYSTIPGFDPRNPAPDKCNANNKQMSSQSSSRQLLQFGSISDSVGLPSGVKDVPMISDTLAQFSQLMCGVSSIATDALSAAKSTPELAEKAIDKAESAATGGLDLFSGSIGGIMDMVKKIGSFMVYALIGGGVIFVVGGGGYYAYKAIKGDDCCVLANDETAKKSKYSKRSKRVADKTAVDSGLSNIMESKTLLSSPTNIVSTMNSRVRQQQSLQEPSASYSDRYPDNYEGVY